MITEEIRNLNYDDLLAALPRAMSLEHMGMDAAKQSFGINNSGSRKQMATAMTAQAVLPKVPTVARCLHGLESQLAEYTVRIQAPCDLIVKKVISKYPRGIGDGSFAENPLITVIFQHAETGQYGSFHIQSYHNQEDRYHEVFGFKYKLTLLGKQLHPGMRIAEGAVLAKGPSVTEDGTYMSGLGANLAYMELPHGIEDGFRVSREWVERASPIGTMMYTCSSGNKWFLLNMYGDKDNFIPFPAIGQGIRADGILYAMRVFDPVFNGIDMTAEALMVVDRVHDNVCYVDPKLMSKGANASVIDITVLTTTTEGNKKRSTPVGMELAMNKYVTATSTYWKEIADFYFEVTRGQSDKGSMLQPEFQTLVTRAFGDVPSTTAKRTACGAKHVHKSYRDTPIDEFTVEIRLQYTHVLDLGGKTTNLHGHKGVFCLITPRSEMPRDEFGNIADIVYYTKGVIGRLNPGQLYEHFLNATARDVSKDIRKMVDAGKWDDAWNHYVGYIEASNPAYLSVVKSASPDEIQEVVEGIYADGIYNFVPANSGDIGIEVRDRINAFRPPDKSPVTYVDTNGNTVTTLVPVLIGEVQQLILEKILHKPAAVAGAPRGTYGLIIPPSKSTKYNTPGNQTAPRGIGESESRNAASVLPKGEINEVLQMSTDPKAHASSVRKIYTGPNPCQVPDSLDRDGEPSIGRAAAYVRHILRCYGIDIVNEA